MLVLPLLLAVDLVGGWQTTGPANGGYTSEVAVAAGSGDRVYAAAFDSGRGNGVYRSDDGGGSWERVSDTPGPDFIIWLAVDPYDPDHVFAATLHAGFSGFTIGVFRSLDGGVTWTHVHGMFLASTCHLAFDPGAPGVLYLSYGGQFPFLSVYRSDDGGETFTAFTATFSGALLAVAVDGTVVAAAETVYVSHNRGQSWTRSANPGVRCPILALAVDPVDAGRWYLGTGQTLFPCGEVARTENGGATWTLAADPKGAVNDLAAAASQPGWIYASTGPPEPSVAPGHVLASADGGTTWSDLGAPPTDGILAIDVSDDGARIYAATGGGVYQRRVRRPTTLPPR